MRVGISGTHGTGKTTLAETLCAHLPGHGTADEPYYLLEEEGDEFGRPRPASSCRRGRRSPWWCRLAFPFTDYLSC